MLQPYRMTAEVELKIIGLEEDAQAAADKGRYSNAIEARAAALLLSLRLARPRLTAVLFNRLGLDLNADGQVQKAVLAYQSGLKMLGAGVLPEIDALLTSLGTAGQKLEANLELPAPDLHRASTAEALDLAEADRALSVRLLLELANAYLRQRQEILALDVCRQALDQPEIDDFPELRAHALTKMGLAWRRRGELGKAQTSLKEALQLFEAHAKPVEKRRVLVVLAGISREKGQLEQARQLYVQATALYGEIQDPNDEACAWAGLGHLLLQDQQYPGARRAFERALALAPKADEGTLTWHVHWGLGRCQRQAGDLAQAAQSFRSSLDAVGRRRRELHTDEGKSTFLAGIQDIFDDLIAVHVQLAFSGKGHWKDALVVVEESRGRALYDLMGSRRRRRLPEGQRRRPTRFRPFSSRLDNFRSDFGPGELPGSPGDPVVVSQTAPGTQPVTSGEWFAPAAAAEVVLPDDDGSPRANEAHPAVEPVPLARLVFHVLPTSVVVLAVPVAGDVYGHVVPWKREETGARVAELRRALQVDEAPRGMKASGWGKGLPEDYQADYVLLLERMYAELVAPVAGLLPADGTPVVIEPHGALWLLPFAALLDEERCWLSDRWPLLYAPSWQMLDEIRREPDYGGPGELRALVIGDPVMPSLRGRNLPGLGLEQLPGAQVEAKAIASMFSGRCTLLTGPRADRTTIESLAGEHGILHLATHTVAWPESPLASFVAVGHSAGRDGFLTVRQIASLSLPADLVVLSACQTGLGTIAGEGMIALIRAFLVAGARTVVLSHWNVSDRATARLMKSFYHWYAAGDDKALALQRAMRELRDKPGYDHPRYWASFVAAGAET